MTVPNEVKGERVNEYCSRLKISHMTFWRRLRLRRCPDLGEVLERGPSGRVLAIYPTERFDEFVRTGL